jgi:hypothetical protein
MRCIARITNDTYSQKFGDNQHKFYVEIRCNTPCIDSLCNRCLLRKGSRVQHHRTFHHGNMDEPIPDISHIYGGKWYDMAVIKYGSPSNDAIEFAEKYRQDAYETLVLKEVEVKEVKVEEVKVEEVKVEEVEEVKEVKEVKVKVKIKEVKRSKPKVAPNDQLIQKDVSIPTHIETTLEEIDTEDCKIEYIPLSTFEHNGTTYFKYKNKLYKKIHDKIGTYVGKIYNGSIIYVPDSDDEN